MDADVAGGDGDLNAAAPPGLLRSSQEVFHPLRSQMIALPGGTFLMGTSDSQANPQDGEGPVRDVTVNPFLIDPYPVTNDDFAQFVESTGYRTEAEHFG